MGLFFNKKTDIHLYQGDDITERNQAIYRSDNVSIAMEEQNKAFEKLNVKYNEMEKQLRKQRKIQSDRWKETGLRFDEIVDNQSRNEQIEQEIIGKLDNLDRKHADLQRLLDKKKQVNEELASQITQLSIANAEIVERLNKVDNDQERLLHKMDEQIEKQNLISHSLEVQKDAQEHFAEKLEQQEGLIEKLIRQVDFLKSVVFERTHFIAEKIDRGYEMTTNYISGLKDKSKHTPLK